MIEITEENYPEMVTLLARISAPVLAATEKVDLAKMRSVCERFEIIAPLVETTAYQRGGDLNLRDQATFLKALEEFVTTLRTLDRRPAMHPTSEENTDA